MTQDEIIEMARQAGFHGMLSIGVVMDAKQLEAFAKADDAIYRSLCRQAHKKRWDVLTENDVDNAIRARGQA